MTAALALQAQPHVQLSSVDDLEQFIRQFTTWDSTGRFDFGSALQLLSACIDLIREHAGELDLEDLEEHLNDDQMAFVERLVQVNSAPH